MYVFHYTRQEYTCARHLASITVSLIWTLSLERSRLEQLSHINIHIHEYCIYILCYQNALYTFTNIYNEGIIMERCNIVMQSNQYLRFKILFTCIFRVERKCRYLDAQISYASYFREWLAQYEAILYYIVIVIRHIGRFTAIPATLSS